MRASTTSDCIDDHAERERARLRPVPAERLCDRRRQRVGVDDAGLFFRRLGDGGGRQGGGKSTADYRPYLQRSQNYRNVFNPVPNNGWKFAQPKDAQGNWVAGFDPTAAEKTDFSESNSWVDTWNIFHDFPASLRCSAARASSSRSSTARSIRPIR